MILNDVAELLAIGGTSARVGIEHDVTFRCHPLELVLEDPAVGGVGTAMDI